MEVQNNISERGDQVLPQTNEIPPKEKPEQISVVEEEKPKKINGHALLVDHFASDYLQLTREELANRIFSDQNTFENALRLYHEDVYSHMDYLTFQTEYLKKFGHPLGDEALPKHMREYRGVDIEEEKFPSAFPNDAHLESFYEWEKIASNLAKQNAPAPIPVMTGELPPILQYNELETQNPYQLTDEKLAQVKANVDAAAYEHLISQDRLSHPDMTADEFLIESSPQAAISRMYNRSPMERALGTLKGEETLTSYQNKATFLSDELQNITNAVGHLDRQLTNKYGEDLFEKLQSEDAQHDELKREVLADPVWQQRDQFAKLHQKNIKKASNFIGQPEFSSIRKILEEQNKKQLRSDILYESGIHDKVVMSNRAMRGLGRIIGGIGALMDIGEEFVGKDKKYTWWDATEDYLTGLNRDITNYYFPAPTAQDRKARTKQANWKFRGLDVVVEYDKNNNPVGFRTPKGTRLDGIMDQLTPTQKESLRTLDSENKLNWSAVGLKTGELLTDLAIQVAITRGVGSLGTAAGLSSKVAGTIGMTAAVTGQMVEPLYNEMKEKFGEGDKAAGAAISAAVGIGLLSQYFGFEKAMAGFGSKTIAPAVATAKSITGKVTPITAASKTTTHLFKSGFGEAFEETIGETMIKDATTMVFGGVPDTNVDLDELAETAGMSFFVGMLGGAVTNSKSALRGNAIYAAALNPDGFERSLLQSIKDGHTKISADMTPEAFASAHKDVILDVKKQIDSLGELHPKTDKGKLADLLMRRRNALAEISNAKTLGMNLEHINKLKEKAAKFDAAMVRAKNTGVVKLPPGRIKITPEKTFFEKVEPKPIEELIPPDQVSTGTARAMGRTGIFESGPEGSRFVSDDEVETINVPPNQDPQDYGIRDVETVVEPEREVKEEEAEAELETKVEEERKPGTPPEIKPTPEPEIEVAPSAEPREDEEDEELTPDEAEAFDLDEDVVRLLREDIDEVFDIDPEEVAVEERLAVRESLETEGFESKDYKELEKFLESVDNPELNKMLENFRALPEHPSNYPDGTENEEAARESFEKHKQNLLGELYEWAFVDPVEIAEVRDIDIQAREQASQELVKANLEAGNIEAAIEAVNNTENLDVELNEEAIDEMIEKAKIAAQRDHGDIEMPTTKVEESLKEEINDQDGEALQQTLNDLNTEISNTNREYTKAQQDAQQEAMDLMDYTYSDMDVSSYIREQTAPFREKMKALRAKKKKVQKLLDEKGLRC